MLRAQNVTVATLFYTIPSDEGNRLVFCPHCPHITTRTTEQSVMRTLRFCKHMIPDNRAFWGPHCQFTFDNSRLFVTSSTLNCGQLKLVWTGTSGAGPSLGVQSFKKIFWNLSLNLFIVTNHQYCM